IAGQTGQSGAALITRLSGSSSLLSRAAPVIAGAVGGGLGEASRQGMTGESPGPLLPQRSGAVSLHQSLLRHCLEEGLRLVRRLIMPQHQPLSEALCIKGFPFQSQVAILRKRPAVVSVPA